MNKTVRPLSGQTWPSEKSQKSTASEQPERLYQLLNRRLFHQVLRPAGRIVDGGLGRVEAQVVIKGGEDFLKMNRPFLGVLAQPVGGADGLTSAHAAAGQDGATHLRPMVTAGVLVDSRRAAKLAPGDYRHVIEHATDIQ